MKLQKRYLIVAMATVMGASGSVAAADTQMMFTAPENLSDMTTSVVPVDPDLGMAFKTKLVRMGNGTLITLFGDGVDSTKVVYDVKADSERPARDVFVKTCKPDTTKDCSLAVDWSAAVNLSNTVGLSSMDTDWDGPDSADGAVRKPFWGDSDKPNITNGGSNVMVTWVDKYCPGGAQRSVTYSERANKEVAFSCTYATYSPDNGATWSTPVQLSDGSRDAKQDSSKVNSVGQAVINWQEDPMGLQLGEADGPGDGASGATTSKGTDIWFATTTTDGAHPTGVTTAARLTDNLDMTILDEDMEPHDVIKDISGNVLLNSSLDRGIAGASRPNVALVTNTSGSTIVEAYEETKGASNPLVTGKFIRYHNFAYTETPSSVASQAGCIISEPTENSRRVRFVVQASNVVTAVPDEGLRLGIFWKQGTADKGGPSDIVARIGLADLTDPLNPTTGVDVSEMSPAVDSGCVTSDYGSAAALVNAPAINISSNTQASTVATSAELSAVGTGVNDVENALAHRGAIVGNDLYIGYSYTPNLDAAIVTHTGNYDFWLRHYDSVTGQWTASKNLSNLPSTLFSVREPRLVKTPYATSGYNPDSLAVAWGTQTNVDDPQDHEIFYTRTFDKAATFEPVVKVANPDGNKRFESQLRPTPDGLTVYSVWNETSIDVGVDALISKATSGDVTGDDPYDGMYDAPVATTSSGGSAAVFGDMIMPALLGLFMGLIGFFGLRKVRK